MKNKKLSDKGKNWGEKAFYCLQFFHATYTSKIYTISYLLNVELMVSH